MAIALVTGARKGLGLEWVRQLLAAGDQVIACVRSVSAADELQALQADVGADRLMLVELDVDDEASVLRAADEVAGLVPHLDLLVNNAGVNGDGPAPDPARGPLGVLSAQALLGVLRTNTVGPLLVAQSLRHLLAVSGAGVIVNTASRLGSVAIAAGGSDPYARDYGYRASKAGLNMVTALLAEDLREDGVVVVSLSPGWVRTDLGTAAADLSIEESVTAQRATIASLAVDASGRYVGQNGDYLPW